jgi:MFS family permease
MGTTVVTVRRLREAGFFRIWVAETTSLAGSQVTLFALPLVAVVYLHASAWQMGLLAAVSSAATLLFGLSAGVLADRYERIRLMQWCNVSRILLVLAVPVLYLTDGLDLWVLLVVGFCVAAVTLVYDSARAALVPSLIEVPLLPAANSWMQGSVATADVVGPGAAGLLVQLAGAPLALLADGVSYLVGALTLRGVPRLAPKAPGQDRRGHLHEVREGLGYVWRDRVQRPLAVAAGHYNLFHAMFFAVFTLYAIRVLHLSVFELGVIGVGTGLAGLIAVALGNRIAERFGYGRTMFLVYLLPGGAAALVPLTPAGSRWTALALVTLSQFAWSLIVVVNLVVSERIKQARTPDALMGRVTSSLRFVGSGADPVGALLGGALGSSALGLRGTLLLASCGLVSSACWPMAGAVRRLRTVNGPAVLPEPAGLVDAEVSGSPSAGDVRVAD